MRISATSILVLAATLAVSNIFAQESPVIRADSAATKASQKAAMLTPRGDGGSSATAVTIKPAQSIFAKNDPVPVASWDGGQLTNVEVSATLTSRRPSNIRVVSPEQFAELGHPQQVETVKQIAYERILLQQARAAGINEQTSSVAAVIADQEEAMLNRIYYNDKVIPRLDELTHEAAKKLYDETKDKLYTLPAHSLIRVLHISTLEMVTAEEDDTLEGLAKAVTGDAAAAASIRQGEAPFFPRQPATELEDKVLTAPLKAGEVLYVPKADDAVASATALAATLREQLLAGKSIDEVAAETKDSDFAVTASPAIRLAPEAGLYDAIVKAGSNMDKTTVSEVLTTPVGLDILLVEDRQTTRVTPFKDVEEQLLGKVTQDESLRRSTIEETRAETLKRLWEKFNVKINEEAIARPNYMSPEPLSTGTVMAEAEGLKYTLEQFLRDLRMTGKDWGQLTRQERVDVIKIAPTITNFVIAKDARAMGLDKTPEFQEMIKGVAESEIVAAYRKTLTNPEDSRVTDEELRAYYTDHLDKYTSGAEVTLREISKRINMTLPADTKAEDIAKARKSLEETRSRIKSQEDFAQLARRESEAISTRSRGGLIGTVPDNFRGENFKNQIRQLKPGEISEPFLYGSEVMIIRMDDRVPPTVQPFEQVKRQVMRDYALTMPQKIRDQQREKTLKSANFKLLF